MRTETRREMFVSFIFFNCSQGEKEHSHTQRTHLSTDQIPLIVTCLKESLMGEEEWKDKEGGGLLVSW